MKDMKNQVMCGDTIEIIIAVRILDPTSRYHFLRKSSGYLS